MDYNRIVDESKLQHHGVEAAGLKWHYVEMGQGEPVVLLHGIFAIPSRALPQVQMRSGHDR